MYISLDVITIERDTHMYLFIVYEVFSKFIFPDSDENHSVFKVQSSQQASNMSEESCERYNCIKLLQT